MSAQTSASNGALRTRADPAMPRPPETPTALLCRTEPTEGPLAALDPKRRSHGRLAARQRVRSLLVRARARAPPAREEL